MWIVIDSAIVRVSQEMYKLHLFQQHKILKSLYDKNILTKYQYQQGKFYIDKNKVDFSHCLLQIIEQHNVTNEIRISYHVITKSEKDVKVVASLVEEFYGEQVQSYPVLKITDNLFLTSHSIVNLTKMELLKFDEEKGHYVDTVNNKDFSNLTMENNLKMFNFIKNYKEYNIVKKIDIENAKNIIEEAAALNFLEEFKKGTFDKNTYTEIQYEMDKLDIKITEVERAIIKELDFYKIKPKDEL